MDRKNVTQKTDKRIVPGIIKLPDLLHFFLYVLHSDAESFLSHFHEFLDEVSRHPRLSF